MNFQPSISLPMVYPTVDLTLPHVPHRSCLYPIPPVGIGTPYVESLTSYISRLAVAHHLSFGTLYERLLIPTLNKAYLTTPSHLSPGSTLIGSFRSRIKNINGIGKLAHEWAGMLEALTLRNDIQSLTLTKLSHVTPHWELLRTFQAWCPACYEEMLQAKQIIYQPLLWTINAVNICARHGRPLVDHCPHCSRQILPLTRRVQIGFCSRCGYWLGEHQGIQVTVGTPIEEDERAWRLFVTKSVGDLLAALAHMNDMPTKEKVMEALHECIAISTGGVITQFAKLIGSSTATVSESHRGKFRIPLSGLLKICYCLDLSIMDFLMGKNAILKSKINVKELPNAAYVVRNHRTPRPFDRRKAEMELGNFLNVEPPVSMAEAARRIGVHHRDLYRIFPELCRKISVRYKNYQQELYRIERVKREEEVRRAVIYLYSQGIYVSPRPVVNYLNKPTYLGRRDVAAIIRETREKLDSEKKAG
jgi:TniQ